MAEGGSEPAVLRLESPAAQRDPPPEVQRAELGELLKAPLRNGEDWYLIDSRWFKQWKKYVGYDSWDMYNMGERNIYPGPIDNSGLFADPESQILKEHLIDELDYMLVPTEAWQKLVGWYGCLEGQQPIVRKVIEHGLFVKHCKVEVYLLELKLCEISDPDNLKTHQFSKADTIETIEKEMRNLFNIPKEKETRLWNRYMSNTFEQLSKPDSTVQDAGLYQGQVLVIEQKNEDGTWPRQTLQGKPSTATSRNCTISSKTTASFYSPSSSTITNGDSSSSCGGNSGSGGVRGTCGSSFNNYTFRESELLTRPGLCGLSNLGNTCFMNSALQCLSNTQHLTDYFLTDKYELEINRQNPLGMKGEIAVAYADLVKQMWSGRNSYVAPRIFKTQVGRFAPQFSGYQQQDSQELLAFLLDGLHEDLNRVKRKPYLELKDANGRPDSVVAEESWNNHRLRNNSIIVDIFHGLFKSTLVCPECAKVSVTFDPFCYLTLPLPMKKDRTMEVYFVWADPQLKPMQYRVTVPKMGAVADLCAALSNLTKIPAESMVVADVYNHRFHKIFRMEEGLNHIMDRDDIYVYQVSSPSNSGSECLTLQIYFRERRMRQANPSSGIVLYGQPLLISIPKHILTVDYLYDVVFERIRRFIKYPLPEEYTSMSEVCNGSNGMYEGEEDEMDHQNAVEEFLQIAKEDTKEQHEVKVEDEHAERAASPVSNVPKKVKAQSCRKKLFSISIVNSYGTSDINSITADGTIPRLNSYSTVAVDWDSEIKKLYFDDQEAEARDKHESMLKSLNKRQSLVALEDCIELFTTMETLGEHDPWYCPNCKKHQQATKKFDLWSLPEILVVHLKRFSYNRYWRDKIDTVVHFPISDLQMSSFVCDPKAAPYVYDLIAVSNHFGGMGGGHYTAFAKNKIDGNWYNFDDSSVSKTSEDQIVTKAAYVLFYQRRNTEVCKSSSAPASLGKALDENDEGCSRRVHFGQECDSMDTN